MEIEERVNANVEIPEISATSPRKNRTLLANNNEINISTKLDELEFLDLEILFNEE